jgi:hypothetical protein
MKRAPRRTDAGFAYRDPNKNGRLDPDEAPRRPVAEWVDNLPEQLTRSQSPLFPFGHGLAS